MDDYWVLEMDDFMYIVCEEVSFDDDDVLDMFIENGDVDDE